MQALQEALGALLEMEENERTNTNRTDKRNRGKMSGSPRWVELGKRLRRYRLDARLTQGQVANKVSFLSGDKISAAGITQYELGVNEPSASRLEYLARALGVTIEDLLCPAGSETARMARGITLRDENLTEAEVRMLEAAVRAMIASVKQSREQ